MPIYSGANADEIKEELFKKEKTDDKGLGKQERAV
jgi:hypothetical protein